MLILHMRPEISITRKALAAFLTWPDLMMAQMFQPFRYCWHLPSPHIDRLYGLAIQTSRREKPGYKGVAAGRDTHGLDGSMFRRQSHSVNYKHHAIIAHNNQLEDKRPGHQVMMLAQTAAGLDAECAK